MGSIAIPTTGKVYCDASIFIYSLESHPLYGPMLIPFWQAVQLGQIAAITSELSVLEVLIRPFNQNDSTMLQGYQDLLFTTINLQLLPIDRIVLIEAAKLRATHQIRSPDSIHLATAQVCQADSILTNDLKLRTKSIIPIIALDDLYKP